MIESRQFNFFRENGYLIFEELIQQGDIDLLRNIYEKFLSGEISTGDNRSDLSGSKETKGNEKIIQIMRPSQLYAELNQLPVYDLCLRIARKLLGEDMALDFDMLIDKSPFTDTATPWHQDEAYWIDMPDKRALTIWVALDDVVKENGCMWFIPQSHKRTIRAHKQIGQAGALQCYGHESEAIAAEIDAGSFTVHHGRTVHYSRGNKTDRRRRAFIMNFRPIEMIQFERDKGFDHLGKRAVRQ